MCVCVCACVFVCVSLTDLSACRPLCIRCVCVFVHARAYVRVYARICATKDVHQCLHLLTLESSSSGRFVPSLLRTGPN